VLVKATESASGVHKRASV
jgi:hypothetical protein